MTSSKLKSHRRYEYDGLKLLRVDERCDADGDGEVEAGETTWRTVEASTYGPGIVGNLLAKQVYSYPGSGDRCTSNGSTDYYYAYDHVGNVYMIFNSAGAEAYGFNQDAFGNELNFEGYAGSSWATAATAGIGEHQTGKWIDSFSGLYFFHARWYDAGVGRWLGRDTALEGLPASKGMLSYPVSQNPYAFSGNNPIMLFDVDGRAFGMAGAMVGFGLRLVLGALAPQAVIPFIVYDGVLSIYGFWNYRTCNRNFDQQLQAFENLLRTRGRCGEEEIERIRLHWKNHLNDCGVWAHSAVDFLNVMFDVIGGGIGLARP